jgi:hypothetical protein
MRSAKLPRASRPENAGVGWLAHTGIFRGGRRGQRAGGAAEGRAARRPRLPPREAGAARWGGGRRPSSPQTPAPARGWLYGSAIPECWGSLFAGLAYLQGVARLGGLRRFCFLCACGGLLRVWPWTSWLSGFFPPLLRCPLGCFSGFLWLAGLRSKAWLPRSVRVPCCCLLLPAVVSCSWTSYFRRFSMLEWVSGWCSIDPRVSMAVISKLAS